MWSPMLRSQVQGLVPRSQNQSPEPRSSLELTEPHCNHCQKPPDPHQPVSWPKISEDAHPGPHPIAPNQSPNATLPAGIFFVLSLPWLFSDRKSTCQCRRLALHVQSLGLEDPLEKETATHSNILAWEIPCTEEPGGLQSMRSQKTQTQLSD